jgi:catechol 2,3-dioxygenase-like lactoylglutathione lyase family enzyme
MVMDPRISIVTLGVLDMQASYDFCSKILGFRSLKGIEVDIVFYSLSYMLLVVCPRDKLAEDAGGGRMGVDTMLISKTQMEFRGKLPGFCHRGWNPTPPVSFRSERIIDESIIYRRNRSNQLSLL